MLTYHTAVFNSNYLPTTLPFSTVVHWLTDIYIIMYILYIMYNIHIYICIIYIYICVCMHIPPIQYIPNTTNYHLQYSLQQSRSPFRVASSLSASITEAFSSQSSATEKPSNYGILQKGTWWTCYICWSCLDFGICFGSMLLSILQKEEMGKWPMHLWIPVFFHVSMIWLGKS